MSVFVAHKKRFVAYISRINASAGADEEKTKLQEKGRVPHIFISSKIQIRTYYQLAEGSDYIDLVDDNGIEPLTLRTSSECSTS